MRRLMQCVGVIVFLAAMAAAQVTTGTISGTVTDDSGGVLPNAKIDVLNEGTGASRTVATGTNGHYLASSLPIGKYKVSVTVEGFKTEVRNGVELTVGGEAVVDLKLSVGAVSESVEVTSEAPLVETSEATVSYLVNDKTMRDLPLNGRDMSQLILLNPGVTLSENSTAAQGFNGYGKRISISGMRGEDNIYLLDGALIGDFRRHIPAGPSGNLLGIENVQEFEVLTNSFGAQYGRALGGVFNAVSKSGTNQVHGDAYEFLRNSDLDARNFFDKGIPPFRRNQFGGTIGGPIKKDKIFFFAGFEANKESVGHTDTNFVPSLTSRAAAVPLMVPYVNAYPIPNGPILAGGQVATYTYGFQQPTTEYYGQARADYTRSDKDSFFFRFTGSHSETTGDVAQTIMAGFSQTSSVGSLFATIGETHIFSPTLLNIVHVSFNRVNPLDVGNYPAAAPGVTVVPGQPTPVPPEVDPGSGITNFGGQGALSTAPTYMISNRFSYQDDVTLTKGAHSLQIGGFFERFQLNSLKPNRANGVWQFSSITNFLQGIPSVYRGAIPGYGTYKRGFRQDFMALYIQDAWRISPKLTANLGVRWEPYTVPTEVNNLISNLRYVTDAQGSVGGPYWQNKSWNNFGPRVGIAYSPFASGKTSIRAGGALLWSPNDPNLYYSQMDRQPPLAYDFTLSIPNQAASFFPNASAQINSQSTVGPAYSLPYANNKSPHVIQWNFNIQQQLGKNDLVTVQYTGSRGIDLLGVGDINMPTAAWDGNSLYFPTGSHLTNPAFPSIIYFGNDTSSWYNGVSATYNRRFSHGFQAQASYTHSVNIAESDSGQTGGGVTSGGGREKYPLDRSAQKGPSGYDFRNIFTFNYSYDLPIGKGMTGLISHVIAGWQTTGVVSLSSGQPLSVTQQASTAQGAIAVTGTRSPNLVLGQNQVHGGPNQYINPAAYTAALNVVNGSSLGELGNLGRNTVVGPGLISWNPAMFKKFKLAESKTLEFRAEAFNVLNRANFGVPANSAYNGTGGAVATLGAITTTSTSSRQVQFGLKLVW